MKNPNLKTIDELLDILNSEVPETSGFENTTDRYLALISKYNLKPGTDKVDWRILHRLFKNMHGLMVSSGEFKRNMGMYFDTDGQQVRTKYYMNQSGIALTEKLNKYLKAKKQGRAHFPKIREHYERYMRMTGVTKGKYYVEGVVLYYLYDEYCFKQRKRPRLGYVGFIEFCRVFLTTRKTSTDGTYRFAIDREAAGLNDEKLHKAQEWGKKFHAKRRKTKKTNKKKSEEVSGS